MEVDGGTAQGAKDTSVWRGSLDGLRYLRCHAPLTVEADRIRRYCDEHKIDLIGVDSVGLACDGKWIQKGALPDMAGFRR